MNGFKKNELTVKISVPVGVGKSQLINQLHLIAKQSVCNQLVIVDEHNDKEESKFNYFNDTLARVKNEYCSKLIVIDKENGESKT